MDDATLIDIVKSFLSSDPLGKILFIILLSLVINYFTIKKIDTKKQLAFSFFCMGVFYVLFGYISLKIIESPQYEYGSIGSKGKNPLPDDLYQDVYIRYGENFYEGAKIFSEIQKEGFRVVEYMPSKKPISKTEIIYFSKSQEYPAKSLQKILEKSQIPAKYRYMSKHEGNTNIGIFVSNNISAKSEYELSEMYVKYKKKEKIDYDTINNDENEESNFKDAENVLVNQVNNKKDNFEDVIVNQSTSPFDSTLRITN